jgi:two-component system, OmpR family, KDP operon response regulator KdpE
MVYMSARILVVEDDREVSRLLQLDLKRNGYEVVTANNGIEGLRVFNNSKPDLVVLDVALPLMDGRAVCQRIREISDVPILMMTAHAVTEEDIAKGLDMGADEYLLKPLRTLEFQARVRALLRRNKPVEEDKNLPKNYKDDYLSVDLVSRRVYISDEEMRLTPTEFKLLSMFIQHPGEVLTFQQLLEGVWGFEYTREHHYPRIYVSHLRHKIEPDAKTPTYIQNEYGIGYRFMKKEDE